MSRLSLHTPWVACLLIAACSPATPPPAHSEATPPASAPAAPSATVAPALPAVSSAPAPAAAPSAAAPSASAPAPVASASAAPPAEAPLPKVTVTNIGMHIGGGPNDAATKEPIKLSVEPYFDAFRKCYPLVEGKGAGDFGIDLKIGKDGGKAKLSEPRTAMKGAAFKDCVVKVFEGIEFRKPKGGATVVSYSLRFTPTSTP